MSDHPLSRQQAEAALQELRDLAQTEYGVELERLFFSGSEEDRMRLVRLAGIVVKRPFAEPQELGGYVGNFGASRAWLWDERTLDQQLQQPAAQALPEAQLLEAIQRDNGWDQRDVLNIAQEAGLMYVIGRWLHGKLTEDEARSFVEVYHQKRSKETDLAINIANLLPVVGFFAGVTGVPALGVSLAMLLVQYGFEKLTEPDTGPDT